VTDDKGPLTLGRVLAKLIELGNEVDQQKATVDMQGLFPAFEAHRTAVFIRIPYPGAANGEQPQERLAKLAASFNRPDTIKADFFTVIGRECYPGFQPWLEPKDFQPGMFDVDRIQQYLVGAGHKGYVLHITVDIVTPDVLDKAFQLTK